MRKIHFLSFCPRLNTVNYFCGLGICICNNFICLPFLFPVVHIVYGAGTLCGLLAGKAQPHA